MRFQSFLLIPLLSAALSCAVTPVSVHPVDPAESQGAPYAVKVDGVVVPLERVGENSHVYYARFTGSSRANVEVLLLDAGPDSTTEGAVLPERLVPRGYEVAGGKVCFMVDEPGPRIVELKQDGRKLPPLFVIAEPEEENVPAPGDTGVLNVVDYGVTTAPIAQTARIQRALDDCEAGKGSVVYFPPGRYMTGTLYVHDNTHVYLAGGAVLQAVDEANAFPVDEGRTESGTSGRTHSFSRLFMFDGAKHSSLTGRGTLDANGFHLRNRRDRRVQVIDVQSSQDILIEGVVLRNSASWTLHILYCDGVTVRNVKIIDDWDVANTDGVDPDSSRNVLIENVFCYTGDDSFAVKATNNSDLLQDSWNVTVRNCVVMTRKTALKVGTETLANIRGVRYENIDVVRSSRAFGLWMRDGHTMEDVVYENIRIDLVEVPGEGRSGQPFYMTIENRNGVGNIRNVVFKDISGCAPWRSQFEGNKNSPIQDVLFENIDLKVTSRTMKKEQVSLLSFRDCVDFIFKNVTVDWSEADRDQWSGLCNAEGKELAEDIRQVGM